MEQTNCKHEFLKHRGLWDGKDPETGKPTGGPMAECKNCGKKLFLTWEQWHKIPAENIESMHENKNKNNN